MIFRPLLRILPPAIALLFLSASQRVTPANAQESLDTSALANTVLTVLRERASIPPNIDLSIEPIRESQIKGFFETDITARLSKSRPHEHGEHQHSANGTDSADQEIEMQDVNEVLITSDGHYSIIGDRFALGPNIKADIARCTRIMFRFGTKGMVTVSDPVPSPFPGFNQVGIALSDGARHQFQTFYTTADNRFLIFGTVLPLTPVSATDAMRAIDLTDQPSQGLYNAKIILVEYGDVDCPKSAATHDVIENHVVPKYGNRIRVVFKDLPWTPILTWTWEGSLASQCAYLLDPAKYPTYRSLIFGSQNAFNANDVETTLLQLAEKAGISTGKMSTCIKSESSRSRVEQDVQEARILGISTTPTILLNGKMLIGQQSAEDLDRAIDAALETVKQ